MLSTREKKLRAVAEYKAKKEAIEFQKQEELRKQFPNLFSNDKVQKYQARKLNRIPTSIRNEYQHILEDEKTKNSMTPQKQKRITRVNESPSKGKILPTSSQKLKKNSNKPMKGSLETTGENTSPRASQLVTSQAESPNSPVMTHKPFSFIEEAAAAGVTLWPEETQIEEVDREKDEGRDEIFNFDLDLYSQSIQDPIPQERRRSSACRCGRVSIEVGGAASTRSSLNSSCSRFSDGNMDPFDDGDISTEFCDICQLLAPQVAARNQLMSALRNFMKDEDPAKQNPKGVPLSSRRVLGPLSANTSPVKLRGKPSTNNSSSLLLSSPQISPVKKKNPSLPVPPSAPLSVPSVEIEDQENVIPLPQIDTEQNMERVSLDKTKLSNSHEMTTPAIILPISHALSSPTPEVASQPTPSEEEQQEAVQEGEGRGVSIVTTEASCEEIEEGDGEPSGRGGFYDVLEDGILNGRIQIQVSGRKVAASHVEYFLRIQILAPEEELAEPHLAASDFSSVPSPYLMQMMAIRRYSQFELLYQTLRKHPPLAAQLSNAKCPFPRKQLLPLWSRWCERSFLDERERGLTAWFSETLLPLLDRKLQTQEQQQTKRILATALEEFLSNH